MLLRPFLREAMIPLPVTFISTMSKDGIRNIAPWSCIMPVLRPLDLICAASAKMRDTVVNIRDTRQFVLNLPGVSLVDKVIPTAMKTAPDVDEFLMANLEEKPSTLIRVPGIAGCYAWMECELLREYEEVNYVLLVGKVLRLEVADEYLRNDGSLDVEKAKPLMMTGTKRGMNFCTVIDINRFEPFSAMFPDGKDPFVRHYED